MLGAARRGAIPTNPVRDIGRLPGVRRTVKARSLTLTECQRWIAQLEADPAAVRRDLPDLTRWLLATGVRIGEAIGVDWSSVDLDQATVEIDYKILRVKGQGLQRVRRTKSDAGHRTLPLPEFALRMLERRMADSGGTGPLFPDSQGGWRDPSNLSRELRQTRGSGEFAWVTSHVFRKTCATLLDEGELSARQIARARQGVDDPGQLPRPPPHQPPDRRGPRPSSWPNSEVGTEQAPGTPIDALRRPGRGQTRPTQDENRTFLVNRSWAANTPSR